MNSDEKLKVKMSWDKYGKIRRVVEYTEYTMDEVIMALMVIAFPIPQDELDYLGMTELVQTVKTAIKVLDLET